MLSTSFSCFNARTIPSEGGYIESVNKAGEEAEKLAAQFKREPALDKILEEAFEKMCQDLFRGKTPADLSEEDKKTFARLKGICGQLLEP